MLNTRGFDPTVEIEAIVFEDDDEMWLNVFHSDADLDGWDG